MRRTNTQPMASTARIEIAFSSPNSVSIRVRLAAAKRLTPVQRNSHVGCRTRTRANARSIAAKTGPCPSPLNGDAWIRAQINA